MRVLIADDEPAIRTVLRRVLMRHFAVEIIEAENGLDALERLSKDHYSLVLLDVNMPIMTGTEALRALRRHPKTATLPVIMMTGNTDESLVRQIMTLGVSDYVIKPVRPAFVVERVARLMDSLLDSDPAELTPLPPSVQLQIGPRTRVLLVDGSADFRQFFCDTVGAMCRVSDSSGGIDALKRYLAEAPDIVFIGSETGVISPEDLAHKLRHSPRSSQINLVRILPPRATKRERTGDLYDGMVARTFVASALRASVEALTREPGSMHQLQTLVPQLKLLAMASVEQAAAVALGATVTPKDRALGSTKKSLEATVNLEVRHDVVTLTVTVGANLRSSTAIAARLRETLPEEVTSERRAEALGEFATTVAERLSAALEEAGVQTTPSLPVVSMDGKKRRSPSPEALLIVADSCPAEFSVYVRIDGHRRASG
jgi:two-component system chemotaxis response regulator CheY